MFAAWLLLCLGLGVEPVLEPLLARRHDDLLRRLGAPEAATASDLADLQGQVEDLASEIEVIDPRRTAALWSRLARWAAALGDPAAAAEAHARGAEVSRRSGDRIGEALALHQSGLHLRALGRSTGALAPALDSARIFLEAGAPASEALARAHAGRILEDLGKWQEAAREYKRVLRLAIDLGGHRVESAEVLNRLGLVLVEMGQDGEGTRCFEAADRLCGELEDPERAARLAMERARAHERRERLDEALEDLERAAEHYLDADDPRKAARAGLRRGAVLLRKGKPGDAIPLLDAAIAALENPGDGSSLMDVFVARARALAALGRADEAVRDWTEGMARARGREGPLRIAELLVSRAADMAALGRLEDALRDATEGLEAFEALELEPEIAGAARARAALLAKLGRPAEAVADLTRAEEIHARLGNRVGRNAAALRRAGLLSILGRDEEALLEYERLIPDLEASGRQDLVRQAVLESGSVLLSLGRPGKAIAGLDAISGVVQTDGTEEERLVHSVLRGSALVDLGRFAETLEALEPASGRARADDMYRARALLQRGRALRGLRRTGEALEALGAAEKLAVALGDLETAAGARRERGDMHLARGESREAIGELSRAAEALDVALQERARFAEGGCAGGLPERSLPILSSTLRALRETRGPSQDLVASAYRVAQVFRGGRMAARPTGCRAARVEDVQEALPAGTALLEIVDDGEAVTAFVVTRGGLDAVALGTSEEMERDAGRAVESLDAEALRRLGKRVLGPLLARLPAGQTFRTLLISPGGCLSFVPFEALLTADAPPGSSPRDWPYLVKAFAVAHVHSGTALRESILAGARPGKNGRRRFVAFARPWPGGTAAAEADYPKPPGSGAISPPILEALSAARLFAGEAELLEILRLESRLGGDPAAAPGVFHEGAVTLFLGDAATEKAFKTRPEVKEARALHIACEGQADLDAPARSYLALAGGEESEREDGRVTPGDLSSLDLAAEVVVLSGCEVAPGSRRPLEGSCGLPRAALEAGATSVLSTLRRVEGRPAREILEGFYRMWLEGSATRTGALATAKRMAIKDGVPIGTWSAYILWDTGG